jgi:hypothetical protein
MAGSAVVRVLLKLVFQLVPRQLEDWDSLSPLTVCLSAAPNHATFVIICRSHFSVHPTRIIERFYTVNQLLEQTYEKWQ